MRRKNLKKSFSVLGLILLLALNFVPVYASDKSFSLSIIYNSDTHGLVDRLPYFKSLIDEARMEEGNFLVLYGGDIFLRGEFEDQRGIPEMTMMNAIAYDAWVIGNNDFRIPPHGGTRAEGNEQLQNLIALAEFPTLCANVTMRDGSGLIENVDPYIIKEFDGVKVAIIGVTSLKPQMRLWEESCDKVFESGEITVAKTIEAIKDEADIFIVLSHCGLFVDMSIAKVGGVSAVIGADDHLVIRKPICYPGPFGAKSAPVVQAGGEQDQYLGRLDLSFEITDGAWTLSDFDGFLYELDGVEPDRDLEDLIEKFRSGEAGKKAA